MSNVTTLSPDKIQKRPSVSSKSLLNIRSIIAQNVSANTVNRNTCSHLSTSVILPLTLDDSLVSSSKNYIHHQDNTENIAEKNRTTIQSFSNGNFLSKNRQKSDLKNISDVRIITKK